MRVERRYVDSLSAVSGSVEGIVMKYGTAGQRGRERFMPGAFGDVDSLDIALNVNHQRDSVVAKTDPLSDAHRLLLSDNAAELRFATNIPLDSPLRRVYERVKSGDLTGASVEFISERESTVLDTRIIEAAVLRGIALVDRPSYPESVIEARSVSQEERRRVSVSGSYRYNSVHVMRNRGTSRKLRVSPGAFQSTVLQIAEVKVAISKAKSGIEKQRLRRDAPEVSLVDRGGNVLASTRGGNLDLTDSAAALGFSATLVDTTAASDLMKTIEAMPDAVGVQPVFLPAVGVEGAEEEVPEEGSDTTIRQINSAVLTHLRITPRVPKGNESNIEL